MEVISIKADKRSPEVVFDGNKGTFSVSGNSYFSDTAEFYRPLMKYIEEYAKNPQNETRLKFKLENLNSSSTKYILDMFKAFDKLHRSGNTVTCEWHYSVDDDEIREDGREYSRLFSFSIELIGYEEEE